MASDAPTSAKANVFVKSSVPTEFTETVSGFDFNSVKQNGGKVDFDKLLHSYKNSGYQATNFGLAVDEINRMVKNFIKILI
jgi:deoxyhypusine synthase